MQEFEERIDRVLVIDIADRINNLQQCLAVVRIGIVTRDLDLTQSFFRVAQDP